MLPSGVKSYIYLYIRHLCIQPYFLYGQSEQAHRSGGSRVAISAS